MKIGILGEIEEAVTGTGTETGRLQGGTLGVTMMKGRHVEIETYLKTAVVVVVAIEMALVAAVERERRV